MAIRNEWRIGSHLVTDDESGLVHYVEDTVKLWDGSIRHKDSFETRQPQEFVRAPKDPQPVMDARPETLTSAANENQPLYIGTTTILFPTNSPASHIFRRGIGWMVIQGNPPFRVE